MAHRDTPTVAGVYFLFKDGELAYVGRSHDCYGRIASHRSKGRAFDLATVMPLALEFIGQVEGALIQAYRPQQNRHVPTTAVVPYGPEPERGAARQETDFWDLHPDAPRPDALGTYSRAKARRLAVCMGVSSYAIAEGERSGAIRFVDTGRPVKGGTLHVALFDEVRAFCERERAAKLDRLGLSPGLATPDCSTASASLPSPIGRR